MNPALCNVVSILIGAVLLIGGLALLGLIGYGLDKAYQNIRAFIISRRKPLTHEQELARLRRQEKRQQIKEKISVVCMSIIGIALLIGMLWTLGSPVCDAVFHK